jgi:UDP-galactopyranose mutase
VHFVGRLATYKYYNMDQIVAQALTVYAKMVSATRKEAVVMVNGRGNSNHTLVSPAVLTPVAAAG